MTIRVTRKKIISAVAFIILVFQAGVYFGNKTNTPFTSLFNPTPSPSIFSAPTVIPTLENKQLVKVTRIVDGDTIEIEGGVKVRYIGINTPELKHANKKLECFGQEAKEKNTELVLGKSVYLEKDVSEVDKFGRLLRYVWVDNIFINDFLVRQGYASVDTFPPDVKYRDQFRQAQEEARINKRGLWEKCK